MTVDKLDLFKELTKTYGVATRQTTMLLVLYLRAQLAMTLSFTRTALAILTMRQ